MAKKPSMNYSLTRIGEEQREKKMEDEEEQNAPPSRLRHIKKRSLKNKSLSIPFDEKDLRNYVTGFHKRKKKRRKEALKLQEEALRRKRIEERKKRKLEREFVLYGGVGPTGEVSHQYNEEDEDHEHVPSVSGTKTYDNGDLKVTVTTSEISHEDEEMFPSEKPDGALVRPIAAEKKNVVSVAKKKPFKRVARHKPRPKSQNRRDKKKRNNKGKKGK